MSNVEIRTHDNGPLLVTGEIVLTFGVGGHFPIENTTIALSLGPFEHHAVVRRFGLPGGLRSHCRANG